MCEEILKNEYPCKVEYTGLTFPSVRNAYYYAKSLHSEDGPRDALVGGDSAIPSSRINTYDLHPHWPLKRLTVMYDIVLSKFMGNPELCDALLSTTQPILYDGAGSYWGVERGAGSNRMGIILEQVKGVVESTMAPAPIQLRRQTHDECDCGQVREYYGADCWNCIG